MALLSLTQSFTYIDVISSLFRVLFLSIRIYIEKGLLESDWVQKLTDVV